MTVWRIIGVIACVWIVGWIVVSSLMCWLQKDDEGFGAVERKEEWVGNLFVWPVSLIIVLVGVVASLFAKEEK